MVRGEEKAEAIFRRRKAIKCVEHNKLQNETNNQPEQMNMNRGEKVLLNKDWESKQNKLGRIWGRKWNWKSEMNRMRDELKE